MTARAIPWVMAESVCMALPMVIVVVLVLSVAARLATRQRFDRRG